MAMSWDQPQEDEFALCNLGVPSFYASIAFPNRPPQNLDFLEVEDVDSQQRQRWKRTLRSFLKKVCYQKNGRLVLKSPTHTFRIPILLEMFPNARFIHMVREPVSIFMSTIRLWKAIHTMHGYQKPSFERLAEEIFEIFLRMHTRLEATRDRIPVNHLMDVRYEDLADDTLEQIETVYDFLGDENFGVVRPAVEAYAAEHASYQPNRYAPSREVIEQIYDRWRPYAEKYGYAPLTPRARQQH